MCCFEFHQIVNATNVKCRRKIYVLVNKNVHLELYGGREIVCVYYCVTVKLC